MEPYERAQATVNVTATRGGTLTIVACFHSKELGGVSGTTEINVIAPKLPVNTSNEQASA